MLFILAYKIKMHIMVHLSCLSFLNHLTLKIMVFMFLLINETSLIPSLYLE